MRKKKESESSMRGGACGEKQREGRRRRGREQNRDKNKERARVGATEIQREIKKNSRE